MRRSWISFPLRRLSRDERSRESQQKSICSPRRKMSPWKISFVLSFSSLLECVVVFVIKEWGYTDNFCAFLPESCSYRRIMRSTNMGSCSIRIALRLSCSQAIRVLQDHPKRSRTMSPTLVHRLSGFSWSVGGFSVGCSYSPLTILFWSQISKRSEISSSVWFPTPTSLSKTS